MNRTDALLRSRVLLIPVLLWAAPPAPAVEKEKSAPPYSSLTARVTWGQREVTSEYTRREGKDFSQLRIVNPRRELPTPPYNLIDLRTGEVTILYPQNSTCVRVPAERFAPRQAPVAGFPGLPPLPAGIGPRNLPAPPAAPAPESPGTLPTPPKVKLPEGVPLPPGIGPGAQSEVPGKPPGLPAGVPLPEGVTFPPGVGPGAAPNPAAGHPAIPGLPPGVNIPRAPLLPGFPGGAGAPAPLVKTKQTREIHGLACTLHTLTDPREGTLKMWTTPTLGPFYLLATAPPERRGRSEFLESWPALLRKDGHFPLLAVLEQEGREVYRFAVTALDRDPHGAQGDPFLVPPKFHRTELLDF